MNERENGASSWNKGFISRIKLSWALIKGLLKIRISLKNNKIMEREI